MGKSYSWARSRVFQLVAVLLCMALAGLMVLNTQMSGEAMWFWYGTVFNHGVKLYSALHTALQPLFVLETAAWLRLFGSKIGVYEIPSLLHAFLLVIGLVLVLRQSTWPDWQKAICLLGAFVLTVGGHSYRFDDYHVLAEAFITYALALLLILGRPGQLLPVRREFLLIAALGLICGLTIVTRVTDGAALVTACFLILPTLLRHRKLAGEATLVGTAATTVVLVVRLTGDTFSAYLSNSIFRAAGSKGGTGSIFLAPLRVIVATLAEARAEKKVALAIILTLGFAAYLSRRWPGRTQYIIPAQFCAATVFLLASSPQHRLAMEHGHFFEVVVLFATLGMYPVAAYLVFRYVSLKRQGRAGWDIRYGVLLLPILEWASYSAGAAAEPLTNYYAPVALLLLLVAVVEPLRRYRVWAYPAFVGIMALIAVDGIVAKVVVPYAWQNYHYGPMFQGRESFTHPIYGTMYIDKDLLAFSERVCRDIGSIPGRNQPELLSLPYPYPNYFCGTPPWHNYVQTFFDTATRGTVEQLMREIQAHPPEWIVYQRQINIMNGAERLYNHGRPIAQRDLDKMIMRKLGTGEWKLVDRSGYLRPSWYNKPDETDWYIIHTHP